MPTPNHRDHVLCGHRTRESTPNSVTATTATSYLDKDSLAVMDKHHPREMRKLQILNNEIGAIYQVEPGRRARLRDSLGRGAFMLVEEIACDVPSPSESEAINVHHSEHVA